MILVNIIPILANACDTDWVTLCTVCDYLPVTFPNLVSCAKNHNVKYPFEVLRLSAIFNKLFILQSI